MTAHVLQAASHTYDASAIAKYCIFFVVVASFQIKLQNVSSKFLIWISNPEIISSSRSSKGTKAVIRFVLSVSILTLSGFRGFNPRVIMNEHLPAYTEVFQQYPFSKFLVTYFSLPAVQRYIHRTVVKYLYYLACNV